MIRVWDLGFETGWFQAW